jgi:hypothetical protein
MLRGIFLNTPKAACSIHESGMMIYNALKSSDYYQLDYKEVDENSRTFDDKYDFVVFNYHPYTMGWLDTSKVSNIRGTKIAFILETLPNNPYAMCAPGHFDVYCPLDPSMNLDDPSVYPFPRPLDPPLATLPELPTIPTIGSFGFATKGKGFELVVDAVNNEFDRAIIRIHTATNTVIGKGKPDPGTLEDRCRNIANPGIDVIVTHDYLTKQGLIEWCGQNTLNCFLYDRHQPGLSATTDQAISSGRPLAVSDNETFRHIHDYINPYPKWNLRKSIACSQEGVLAMQNKWSAENFMRRFVYLLKDRGIQEIHHTLFPVAIPKKNMLKSRFDKTCMSIDFHLHPPGAFASNPIKWRDDVIMVVVHTGRKCGVYQYGRNITNSLVKSKKYKFVFVECGSPTDLARAIEYYMPRVILYNYIDILMPWLNPIITSLVRSRYRIPQAGIIHEFIQSDVDRATQRLFDYSIYQDPDVIVTKPFTFKTRQLIYPYVNTMPLPPITTIGSFGFGFPDKGFERLVDAVQEEYDVAKIRLVMPPNDIVDQDGSIARATARSCKKRLYKPAVELCVTHEFLSEPQLLDFLASNTANAFLYDTNKNTGISGPTQHALAAHRPLIITKSGMFRHLLGSEPSICIEDHSMREIISYGLAPLEEFYREWSEEKFIRNYEDIMDVILE